MHIHRQLFMLKYWVKILKGNDKSPSFKTSNTLKIKVEQNKAYDKCN